MTSKRDTLPFVTKPGRYLGHEYNSHIKDWESCSLRCALIFPDLYEIGMSHQGLQILYHILNSRPTFMAERCYCPDRDMEDLLRQSKSSLCSLENNRPLKDFDFLGFTLPYELCYSNILTILDLADIPFYSRERDNTHPLIIGGGSCSLNPEPVADFFDAILLGDGEEGIVDIAECIKSGQELKLTRAELLEKLAGIEGVYVPAMFTASYDDVTGIFTSIKALDDNYTTIRRRILGDLSSTDHLLHPLVPNSKIVHDRLGIEVARGCTRGCRFCQAGMIYRPVRERTPEQIFDLAVKGIENSGFDEIALLSLSTGDYSCIAETLPMLMDRFADEAISVSMPSMRVGTLTETLMDQIKRVRKTGFTLAPEAGSERLRRIINKGITEEDLLITSRDAFSLGWKIMKLYFMIGLPTEQEEDIRAIVDLALKTKETGIKAAKGRQQINISVGTFVPKPHTPFQWVRQISMDESRDKINSLKKMIPRRGINLKWHDSQQSYLEGVFSRGDRKLAKLIETAWDNGARLDGWSDHFNLEIWLKAAGTCEIETDSYLAARDMDLPLPWQHLESGVSQNFLRYELDRAHSESYTPDCRYHACQQCGLCDFKTIMPIVIDKKKKGREVKTIHSASHTRGTDNTGKELHFYYIVHYSRRGDICYLGHLEILQIIFRILRRAGIRTNFSKGFNPSPKISFGPALPVGTESLAEYFIMDLPNPIQATSQTIHGLNMQTPPGIKINSIEIFKGTIPQQILSRYEIHLKKHLLDKEKELINTFIEKDKFLVERTRKQKTRQINIRPLISKLSHNENGNRIYLEIVSRASEAGIKPLEAVAAITCRSHEDLLSSVVLKTDWQELS